MGVVNKCKIMKKKRKYSWFIVPLVSFAVLFIITAITRPEFEFNPETYHSNLANYSDLKKDQIIYINIVKENPVNEKDKIEIVSGNFDLDKEQILMIRNQKPKLILAENLQEAIQYQILLHSIGIENCIIDDLGNEVLKYEFEGH